ncbi:MAG: transcriptional regulator FtrA [Pseudomonadota bacterium]
MNASHKHRRPRVAIMAYEKLCTFEFGIAVEVFALERPELDVPWYECRVFSLEECGLSAMGGISFSASYGPEAIDWADTIIVPGWSGIDVPVPDRLCTLLSAARGKGKRLVSICSGVFVLAASGVLAGLRATTHWRYADQLQAAYPLVQVQQDALYVEDGGVFTSAGSAAGLDLSLHLVKQDYGSSIANAVARRLVLPTHRDGGQAQFVPAPVSRNPGNLAPILDWLLEHLDQPHSVQSMASRAGQSQRTFIRRFRQATGLSPHAWLTAARLRHARELLETTGLPAAAVAERSGFATPETLRHHFRRAMGVPPSKYRQAFRAG